MNICAQIDMVEVDGKYLSLNGHGGGGAFGLQGT